MFDNLIIHMYGDEKYKTLIVVEVTANKLKVFFE